MNADDAVLGGFEMLQVFLQGLLVKLGEELLAGGGIERADGFDELLSIHTSDNHRKRDGKDLRGLGILWGVFGGKKGPLTPRVRCVRGSWAGAWELFPICEQAAIVMA